MMFFWLFLSVFPYMVGTWLWLPALKAGKNLATTGITWSVMSAAATVGIGILLFHEKLNAYNYVGLLLSVLGLALLQIKG